MLGLVPETSTELFDCMDLVMYDNETAKLYDHPMDFCLTVATVHHYYALGITLLFILGIARGKGKANFFFIF